jgi:mRNA-degrading endonuclease toxin of MazEF toxin-antitoxin module
MPSDLVPVARYGDIVIVSQLLDPNGVNPKDRPCVIMDDPKSPPPSGMHLVVAISTVVPDPIPPDHNLLPYYHPRHPVTGLNKRNAAVCPWVEVITTARIIRRIGTVPDARLLLITAELERLSRHP